MLPRKPLPLEWTEPAAQDLDDIVEYLLGESLPFDAVEGYMKRIYKAPEHLTALPGAGKPGRVQSTREWLVKDTPYALIYRVLSDRVQILRVMHGSRQFSEHLSDSNQQLSSTLPHIVKEIENGKF